MRGGDGEDGIIRPTRENGYPIKQLKSWIPAGACPSMIKAGAGMTAYENFSITFYTAEKVK
jgi:hypothetical protein